MNKVGPNKGGIRSKSFYVKAAKHPVVTAPVVTAPVVAGLADWGLAKRKK
ncbi:hypothetical protein J7I81_05250 [Bacillus sp. ISL-32]|nr:hypothetical protein [Bacillus sp. ISL-32]